MSPARYAQHFLVATDLAERIVEALHLAPGETVLEIGPGQGVLTGPLLKSASQVFAVEIDVELVAYLKAIFKPAANFTVIQGDILKFDWSTLPAAATNGAAIKVVGNLPYNLTSPILRRLSNWGGWSEAVIMVQKEVGERLCASVGSSNYGALTAGMSLTCEMRPLFQVSEGSFRPRPKVKSMVVGVRRLARPLSENITGTQKVIQAAFQQRRKTIYNSLSHGLKIDKPVVLAALKKCAIIETDRAERISVHQFIALAGELKII